MGTPKSWLTVGIGIFVLVMIVGGVGWLVSGGFGKVFVSQETQVGMVVVLAIALLLVLICITAVIFSQFSLTNAQQPLGLPEGSIRALIAFFLTCAAIVLSVKNPMLSTNSIGLIPLCFCWINSVSVFASAR